MKKATLAVSRIMIFHKSIPSPNPEEESLIDKHIGDLVDLSLCSKTIGQGDIFDMALRAIRQVHVSRSVSEVSGTVRKLQIRMGTLLDRGVCAILCNL